MVIKWATPAGKEFTEEELEFYMDVVGIELPEPSTSMTGVHEICNGEQLKCKPWL